jgi:hypothetical protein
MARVYAFMEPGRWYRTSEISAGLNLPGHGIYSRMQYGLREKLVQRRYVPNQNGGRTLAEWSLVVQDEQVENEELDEAWPTQRIVPANDAPMLQKIGPASIFDWARE